MRYLTGLDQAVYEHVLATPGARRLADSIVFAAHTLAMEAKPDRLVVATGCAGGRHRAVAMARSIANQLDALAEETGAYTVELAHRDIGRPVLPLAAHN